ncbi:hypothetical protein SYNPS1DRAFT_16893 [Syncephalis pseudoplumigaleata]|uniref:THUMP domain-containing protein n=1 Tax=Syncephalis pseudoplumigaleata TaxID=1712513 RepID=A0A4P9YZZ3_9FUNG|nr:hypothetical protein SYNPS1DRAFT_16893 [Syncephalis pseudoplumigaleata]|eukprot:RKP24630.1 hypothetical protein SYNPS1DRAFT_16893 [Syncephalis pseudoplumigaleata]
MHYPSQAKRDAGRAAGFGIEPNQAGFLITCTRGKEGRCVGEMYVLLNEYAEQLYPEASTDGQPAGEEHGGDAALSVEDEIAQELASLQQAKEKQTRLFTSLATQTECVVFIRTRPPVEPVSMARTILQDFATTQQQRTRYTNRIVPITLTCRSQLDDIERMATTVLAPIFHTEDAAEHPIKASGRRMGSMYGYFAIQPKIRNCDRVDRDELIKLIARVVGPHHKVDLTQPDRTIIVEVLKSICGMSVVENYNELKRFNVYALTTPSSTTDNTNKT